MTGRRGDWRVEAEWVESCSTRLKGYKMKFHTLTDNNLMMTKYSSSDYFLLVILFERELREKKIGFIRMSCGFKSSHDEISG